MDNKNYNSDEEYKLQDATTESASHFSDTTNSVDPASAILEKTQRHHIFLIVFIIFASLGIYKIVSTLIHKMHAPAKPKVVAMVQKPAVPVIPAAVQANRVLDNRFNHIEQEQRELQAHLQTFDSDLNDIRSTLADLNSRLTDINDQTQLLHARQEAFLQKQQKAEAKLIERKKTAPKPIYYVRAIIPGRVWLSLQDGSTLTLGMGDKLAGYGVITEIDPSQGTITGCGNGAQYASVETMLLHMTDQFPNIYRLITALAYLMGIAFIFRGVYQLKVYGDLRTMMSVQTNFKATMMVFFAGTALLYAPTAFNSMMLSTFATTDVKDPMSYMPVHNMSTLLASRAVLLFVQLIGTISFIKGWVSLTHTSNPNGRSSVGKAVTHIVAGLLAVNIEGTKEILQASFGM
ncbi:hypothetical protein FQR65_LT05156 [Abscondita terminalis]|nr:hypothetical protein FQR65_LT05156 [Abscondita terminalis]